MIRVILEHRCGNLLWIYLLGRNQKCFPMHTPCIWVLQIMTIVITFSNIIIHIINNNILAVVITTCTSTPRSSRSGTCGPGPRSSRPQTADSQEYGWNILYLRKSAQFANLRGFFSSFAGGLRFVFNFDLGQWNFACHQPYTKSRCKNIFQVIMSTPSTSTTPSKSTSRCTTSRLSLIKNEHLKHVSWTIFEKKTIWMGPKVIRGL